MTAMKLDSEVAHKVRMRFSQSAYGDVPKQNYLQKT